MGEVWAAFDPKLEREVAIKTVQASAFSSASARARSIEEARTLARLRHENLIAVYDVLEHEGLVAIVMERVHGHTLREWVAQPGVRRSQILAALESAARGLAAANAAGVAHLDFKPDNVLIEAGPDSGWVRAVVADFGLARLWSRAEAARGGTPGYAAPEQWLGDVGVDARADQFAFASTVCSVLGDGPAAPADDLRNVADDDLRAQIRQRVDSTGLGRRQRAVLRRALATSPADRLDSMDALVEAFFDAPKRRRRIAVLTVGAAGSLALGVAMTRAVERPLTPVCGGLSAEEWLEGAWGATQRQGFVKAVTAAPEWTTGASRAIARLDERRRELQAIWPAVCEIDRLAGSDPAATASRRCIERKRRELVTISRALSGADAQTVERAPEITEDLGSLQDCELAAKTTGAGRVVTTAELERAAEVQVLLTNARVQAKLGDREAQRSMLERARILAEQSDNRALLAEVDKDLGYVAINDGKVEAGLAQVEGAYFAAVEAGDELLAADTATLLVHLAGSRARQPNRGQSWAKHARATLTKLDADEIRGARLLAYEGAVASGLDPAESLDDYRRALALLRDSPVEAPGLMIVVLNGIAIGLETSGESLAALDVYAEVGDLLVAEYGDQHPRYGYHLNNYGSALQSKGEFERAIPLHEAARSLGEARGIPRLVSHANTNLCFAHATAGHGGLGLPACRAAVDSCLDLYGGALERCGNEHMALGNTLAKLGQGQAALAAYQKVFDAFAASLEEDDPEMAWGWSSIAAGYVAVEDWSRARDAYERALELGKASMPPVELAEINFGLAKAWRGLGETDRAQTLAAGAAETYATNGRELAAGEVREFLSAL